MFLPVVLPVASMCLPTTWLMSPLPSSSAIGPVSALPYPICSVSSPNLFTCSSLVTLMKTTGCSEMSVSIPEDGHLLRYIPIYERHPLDCWCSHLCFVRYIYWYSDMFLIKATYWNMKHWHLWVKTQRTCKWQWKLQCRWHPSTRIVSWECTHESWI
jgi:hypothetical protein